MWAEYLGAKTWHTLREVAFQVREEKFVLPKGIDTAPGDLLQAFEFMEEEFKAMQDHMQVLEQAVAKYTPSTSPAPPVRGQGWSSDQIDIIVRLDTTCTICLHVPCITPHTIL